MVRSGSAAADMDGACLLCVVSVFSARVIETPLAAREKKKMNESG